MCRAALRRRDGQGKADPPVKWHRKENSAIRLLLGFSILKPPRAWALVMARSRCRAVSERRVGRHGQGSGAPASQCCYKVTREISSRAKGISRNEARTLRRSQMGSTHVKAQFILSVRSILGSSAFSASSVWESFYTSWQIFGLDVFKCNLNDWLKVRESFSSCWL